MGQRESVGARERAAEHRSEERGGGSGGAGLSLSLPTGEVTAASHGLGWGGSLLPVGLLYLPFSMSLEV